MVCCAQASPRHRKNETAAKLREQVAIDTLDELLNYLLHQGGSVGILIAWPPTATLTGES
ncbi:hypothetical protein QBC45DRAFT_393144 [Copromyces sp. CBS 386.78]|nr:hypothetical protein QBC45DRAFT_393144 [Copromyces sp. CBS 386.78]